MDAIAGASTDVSTLGSTGTDASTNVSTGDSTDVSTFGWAGLQQFLSHGNSPAQIC